MEAVKRERSHLMASLAEIKTQSGKAGGELQQEDVRRLRKEVEIKMQKLNEIRKVSLLQILLLLMAPASLSTTANTMTALA